MNEKTEPATPKGLEEAPAALRSPAPTEGTERPPWRPEDLPGQDLRGQDLTAIKGLLPEHLAGADLTGARLPDDIAKFPALDQVAAVSIEARKIFIGLLAACVYSWLVIGTTTDVALILNTASSPLPIINTPIPIAGFYVVGATLLAAVYCYLHFYLQRLWRTLATLPAVFPDGRALDDRTDPWLLTNLVRTQFPRLSASPPPLARLENLLSIVLAWWLVPFTLVVLWARYLPRHDIGGLAWLALLLASTTFFGRDTFRLARATMRRVPTAPKAPAQNRPQRTLLRMLRDARHVRPGQLILSFLMPLIVMIALSLSALWQSPTSAKGEVVVFSLSEPWRSLREFDPAPAKLLNFIGIPTYADFREMNVAERPDGWNGKDWSKVKRVDLRGRNLAFADATRAFLANADLRDANLNSAILTQTELQGADLYDDDTNRSAQLQDAILRNAQLRGADLRLAGLQGLDLSGAQLQDADLEKAQLQGAVLETAQLQGADLEGAQLQGANLKGAELQGAILQGAHLQGADLERAQLQGADLGSAHLQGADLSRAQLQGAVLEGAQLQGAELGPGIDVGAGSGVSTLVSTIQAVMYGGAQLQGADLRGVGMWRASVDFAEWDLADLSDVHVKPLEKSEIDSLVAEATKGIPDERHRRAVAERLVKRLRTGEHPARPDFPEDRPSEPNVIFEPSDPRLDPFKIFEPSDPRLDPFKLNLQKRATGEGYQRQLADFLGNLACGADVPEAQTRGLARRALATAIPSEGGRLMELRELVRSLGHHYPSWSELFAGRLTGPNCPPAKALPEDVRRQLEQLAARGDAATAVPEASPPDPVK